MEDGPTAPGAPAKAATGRRWHRSAPGDALRRAGLLAEVAPRPATSANRSIWSIEEVQAIEPAHWFEDVNRRRVTYVMEIYTGPEPTIELVVPISFRGIFKAKIETQADAATAPGQRAFRYEVPATGEVVLTGSPLLKHVHASNMSVKFADDAPLSHWAKETPIGYWWLKNEAGYHYFLIGTQSEFDAYRHSQEITEKQKRTGSGQGKGGGGGGRGRKGGGGGGGSMSP